MRAPVDPQGIVEAFPLWDRNVVYGLEERSRTADAGGVGRAVGARPAAVEHPQQGVEVVVARASAGRLADSEERDERN